MSNKLCRGIRKDGSPCQGNGLDQYDGYCIAHGPPADQAHAWRSLGGKNSATAVRLDKRIPERIRVEIELLEETADLVKKGELSPAAGNTIRNCVKTKLECYRFADQDMEVIRAEEIQAAAAEFLGLQGNLDVLEAADDMAARQDQHRAEALVDQGFAEVKEPFGPDGASEIFLNDRGRRRFGYRNLASTQQLLDEIEDQLTDYSPYLSNLSEITGLLADLQEDVESSLSVLARDDVAPFDPLTGQAITELPTGVQTRSKLDRHLFDEVKPQERLQEQLSKIKHLRRKAEELAQHEDDNQELDVAEIYGQEPEEAETYEPEPDVAETYLQEPEMVATYGPEPEEAPTYAQEVELAKTYGPELEEAPTYGQKPEEAEQGSKKLKYIKETLKASGVPIESVPAHFRWE